MPFGIRGVPAMSQAALGIELKDLDAAHLHVLAIRAHRHIPHARHTRVVGMNDHVRNFHTHLLDAEFHPRDLFLVGQLSRLFGIVSRNRIRA